MDIHKPKPFHSVKEFLSEISVVVIGIVIALGGEQLVEMFHWHEIVESERTVLHADIQDQVQIIVARSVQRDCVERRLAELDTVLARHKGRQPLGLAGPVGRPQNSTSDDSLWRVAITSQAVSRMSAEERGDLSGSYSNFMNFFNLQREADAAWMDVAVLDRADLLEEGDWVLLRKAVAKLHLMEDRIELVAPYVIETVNAGFKAPKVTLEEALHSDYSKALCRPLLAQ